MGTGTCSYTNFTYCFILALSERYDELVDGAAASLELATRLKTTLAIRMLSFYMAFGKAALGEAAEVEVMDQVYQVARPLPPHSQ